MFRKKTSRSYNHNITADVIILGYSLPGIVTAHKLKKRFGNSMDIVVLDLGRRSALSKCNVSFLQEYVKDTDIVLETQKKHIDNITRRYLTKFAHEFDIQLPESILVSESQESPLFKLFEHRNGSTVQSKKDYHEFGYLNFVERFELNQYQNLLEKSLNELFQSVTINLDLEREVLRYYDQTTMEQHICKSLVFSTSREIMRTMVKLVCGAPPDTVSVLFYLHQCFRTNGCKNHLGGDNIRFREKLVGYCCRRITNQLQQSVADITVPAENIKEIRTYSDEKLILETMRGEETYVCNLLAMAVRPDELCSIKVGDDLLSETEAAIVGAMKPGRTKKFTVKYKENFWRKQGYSGEILSVRGPIFWAMENPRLSTTGSVEKHATLIGYLKAREDDGDSKDAVVQQLVNIFGPEALDPVVYTETDIADVYVPRCGDCVALWKWKNWSHNRNLVWGALDTFGEGDMAAALEAGHKAYINLLTFLRPQAQTFEDVIELSPPTVFDDRTFLSPLSTFSYKTTARVVIYATAAVVVYKFLRYYLRR